MEGESSNQYYETGDVRPRIKIAIAALEMDEESIAVDDTSKERVYRSNCDVFVITTVETIVSISVNNQ